MNKKIISSAVLGSLLLASIVLAQPEGSMPDPVPSITPSPTISPTPSRTPKVNGKKDVDRICMKNAIEKRDNKIITAVDTYTLGVKSALAVRRDALKSAWDKSNLKETRKDQKAAWKAYKRSTKVLRRSFKNDKNSAWKQFRVDTKACRATGADSGGEGYDSQL